ncbi:hypothetical protein HanPI659440_Chr06g0252231 [Helianthus annuus]|nr:hypothetical protein HanPI659440_Chr06g0252231 [Helianthus annuus]
MADNNATVIASSDKLDTALEDAVIPSSSADQEAGGVIRNRKRRRTDNGSENGKQLCTENEKDVSGRDKVSRVRAPRMNRDEFFQRYPNIAEGVGHFFPYCHTPISANVIGDCFAFASPTKLDALEGEWINYFNESCQCTRQRMTFMPKYSALFQLSQGAYKQPANSDNTRKQRVKTRSEFASKYPLVTAGFDDYTCLPRNDVKDIRLDYLMSTAEHQLRELEAEHASFYETRFNLANKLILLIDKQTRLLHVGAKEYRKYHKSITKAVKRNESSC